MINIPSQSCRLKLRRKPCLHLHSEYSCHAGALLQTVLRPMQAMQPITNILQGSAIGGFVTLYLQLSK